MKKKNLKVLACFDLFISWSITILLLIKLIYALKGYYVRAFADFFVVVVVCSNIFACLYTCMFNRLLPLKVNSCASALDLIWILLGIFSGTYVSLFVVFGGGIDFYKFKNGKWRNHGLQQDVLCVLKFKSMVDIPIFMMYGLGQYAYMGHYTKEALKNCSKS